VPGLGLPELNLGRGYPDPINPPPGCHFHPRCPEVGSECDTVSPPVVTDEAGFVQCHSWKNQLDLPGAASARQRPANDA
jgi:peptide/nickel transport system ATP-binding protein